mgnify:CR=1 FL=1
MAAIEDGRSASPSRVVVGDEIHPTPVVRSEMGAIVFNPTWTVPTSIVVDEFLPKLRPTRAVPRRQRHRHPRPARVTRTASRSTGRRSRRTRFPFRLAAAARRLEPARPDALRDPEPVRRLSPRHAAAGAVPARRPGARATAACASSGPAVLAAPSCWPVSRRPPRRPHARRRRCGPQRRDGRPAAARVPPLLATACRRRGSPPAVDDPYDRDARVAAGWPAPRSPPRSRWGRPISGSGQAAGTSAGERPPALLTAGRCCASPLLGGDRALGAPGPAEGDPESEPRALAFRNLPRARASTSSTERTASWTTGAARDRLGPPTTSGPARRGRWIGGS